MSSTMKGFYLSQINNLALRNDLPIPEPHANGVRVKVHRVRIPSNMKGYIAGKYFPSRVPYPLIPGPTCVGIVDKLGSEVVSDLKLGDVVVCAPHIGTPPDGILQGWLQFGFEKAKKLASLWRYLQVSQMISQASWKRDGSLAEYAQYPVENVTAVPQSVLKKVNLTELTLVGELCVAYGGLLRGKLAPGQTVVVTGATGGLGSSTVALSLAMGASRVYALGRNKEVLEELTALDKNRVVIIQQKGEDEKQFAKEIEETVGKTADLFVDALGNVDTAELTLAGMSTVKPKGTIVFMGGVRASIPVSYINLFVNQLTIVGSYMYPTHAAHDLLKMVEGGTLSLNWIKHEEYPFEKLQEAMERAASIRGTKAAVLTVTT